MAKDKTALQSPETPVDEPDGTSATAVADRPADETPPEQPDAMEMSPDEFREQQKTVAAAQNLTSDNAVPEQRPQAFLEAPVTTSPLTEQMRERGAFADEEPMPASAYEKAASEAQMETAAEESRYEQIHVGSVVRATKGPHEGRYIAVTRIEEFQDSGDLAIFSAGIPEQRFVRPKSIEGRARGDERDGEVVILDVEEAGLEIVRDWRGTGRG